MSSKVKVVARKRTPKKTLSSADSGMVTMTVDPPTSCQVIHGSVHGRLNQLILGADGVCAVVAWFTHAEMLKSMQHKPVSLLVQHETFTTAPRKTKTASVEPTRVRAKIHHHMRHRLNGDYNALTAPIASELEGFSGDTTETLDAVRLVRVPGAPSGRSSMKKALVHDKFVVFLKRNATSGKLVPSAVWAGSANCTQTSSRSHESALYLEGESVAHAFFSIWNKLYATSTSR